MKCKLPSLDTYSTGQNIKKYMDRRGMSVKSLQEYLGLQTPQSIYHWFSGKSLPSVDNLYSMSTLFLVPVDKLLCGNRTEMTGIEYGSQAYRGIVYYLEIMSEK